MNSSTLSSNHLSFNSSISQERHDCSHLEQYKKIYNQLSALRIELRATQQETEVMRNTVRGLEEENKYLKGFLGCKKEMITKLNYEIGCCNQEINRLEEELARQRDVRSQMQKKCNVSANIQKQLEIRVNKQKQKSKAMSEKITMLQVELGDKEVNISANEELEQQKEVLKQICKLMQTTLQTVKQQKRDTSFQPYSTSSKSEVVNETVREFNKKWNDLLKNHRLQLLQLQMSAQTQKNQSNLLKVNIQQLKLELAKQTNKVQQQKDKTAVLIAEMQKKQVHNQEISSQYSLINKNKEQMLKKLINELVEAHKKYLGEQNHIFLQRIVNLTQKTEPQSFEMDVLINQLWNMSNLRYALNLKHQLESKKVQKINQQFLELQQQYELLTLNHRTLQREYNELLQDNRRLIKYNTISQFRLRRNVGTDKNQQKEEPVQPQETLKEQNGHSYRTQRKDSIKQKIASRTRPTFTYDKENDSSAYNLR